MVPLLLLQVSSAPAACLSGDRNKAPQQTLPGDFYVLFFFFFLSFIMRVWLSFHFKRGTLCSGGWCKVKWSLPSVFILGHRSGPWWGLELLLPRW